MTDKTPRAPHLIDTARLSGRSVAKFELSPEADCLAEFAETLEIVALRKLKFTGTIRAEGKDGWLLEATPGATATQTCVVTLEPVTTRIDTVVERLYLPAHRMLSPDAAEAEMESPQDDRLEELPDVIDLHALILEAIALQLPDYPKKEGAELEGSQFAEPGVTPLRDADVHPFAGLADLKDALSKKN